MRFSTWILAHGDDLQVWIFEHGLCVVDHRCSLREGRSRVDQINDLTGNAS